MRFHEGVFLNIRFQEILLFKKLVLAVLRTFFLLLLLIFGKVYVVSQRIFKHIIVNKLFPNNSEHIRIHNIFIIYLNVVIPFIKLRGWFSKS